MIPLVRHHLRRSSLSWLGLALLSCCFVSCYPTPNAFDPFGLEPGRSWVLSFERGPTVVYRALLTRGFDKNPSTDASGATYLELQSGNEGGIGVIEGNTLFLAVHLDVAHGRAMGCRFAYPLPARTVKLEVKGFGFLKTGGAFVQDTRLGCTLRD
jgi:hypothetical protein